MVREAFGLFMIRLAVLLAMVTTTSAQEFPKLDSSWRVYVRGQSVPVRDDGSFSIPSVSALDESGPGGAGTAPDAVSDETLRVIGISTKNGVTQYAYSDLFRFQSGQEYSVGPMTLSAALPPFPHSISITSDDALLVSIGQVTQIRVMGALLDGSTIDVTGSVIGTSYTTSNAKVLSVDREGVGTAVDSGVAYITARHAGATATVKVRVSLGGTSTQLVGFAELADGTPVDGVDLALPSQGLVTTTDSDGRYVFPVVTATLGPLRVGTIASTSPIRLVGTSKPIPPIAGGITDGGILILTPIFDSPKIGMVADHNSRAVTVFETVGNTTLGRIELPTLPTDPPLMFSIVGDCTITRDGTLGFVTDFFSRVWVIDLTESPPALADGINPIPISNFGEDAVITPNNRFLLVCGGATVQPVSVIDIASRTEVATFSNGSGCNSVTACPDGSVLVTSSLGSDVRRLLLDKSGNVTGTPKTLSTGFELNNAICAPDASTGVLVLRDAAVLVSFRIPSLQVADIQAMGGNFGVSAEFSPSGDRVYVRSNTSGPDGLLEAFSYGLANGTMGNTPVFSIAVPDAQTFFGTDNIGVHPDGTRLYVSAMESVDIYSTTDGSLIGSIPLGTNVDATGIAIR